MDGTSFPTGVRDMCCTNRDGISMRREVVEVCPSCESDVVMLWNVETDGYRAFCPYCGNRLMLCDECLHRSGGGECDYDKETDTCMFNREEHNE